MQEEKAAAEVVTQLQKLVSFLSVFSNELSSVTAELKLVKSGLCCKKLIAEISPDILFYVKEYKIAAMTAYDDSMLSMLLKTKYKKHHNTVVGIAAKLSAEEKNFLFNEIKTFIRKLVEYTTTKK